MLSLNNTTTFVENPSLPAKEEFIKDKILLIKLNTIYFCIISNVHNIRVVPASSHKRNSVLKSHSYKDKKKVYPRIKTKLE